MKKVFALLVWSMLAFSCSEKEIAPEVPAAHVEGDDEQPPKSNCNGLPNCK